MVRAIFLAILVFAIAGPALASTDNPTDLTTPTPTADVETLLRDAQDLFVANKPIDGRSKLLQALKVAPQDFRPHMFLGAYYLSEVGHFRLALRYLRTAEVLFEKSFGNDRDDTIEPEKWREHARLLYLLAETRLNLDNYQGALTTLDRFAKRYWDDWYPGTRAWVLMKLKNVDEAIRVAQSGLLRGAEPGRTYNILGILLSLKDNRPLALQAFARAIRSELAMGSMGQAATPLNNSGEVYREMYQDDLAEAAFLKALRLPDGCEHILPSLNLVLLYIDQLRLHNAERVLDDFTACYSQHAERSDSEHRALLALARGRIAMHTGNAGAGTDQLNNALDREQWFGKIGTNENDVRFAASVSMASALQAHAAELRDVEHPDLLEAAKAQLKTQWLKFRSWWLFRRSREIALEELNDFEDLPIRNTDTMIEYPTLGRSTAGYPARSFAARIRRMNAQDRRKESRPYYDLYLAQNYLANGDDDDALKLFRQALAQFRDIDRLARVEATTRLIEILQSRDSGVFSGLSDDETGELLQLKTKLFAIAPAKVRQNDLRLPVKFKLAGKGVIAEELVEQLKDSLTSVRFEETSPSPYTITLFADSDGKANHGKLTLKFRLRADDDSFAAIETTSEISPDGSGWEEALNKFVTKVFTHRTDPPAAPVPQVELMESILGAE